MPASVFERPAAARVVAHVLQAWVSHELERHASRRLNRIKDHRRIDVAALDAEGMRSLTPIADQLRRMGRIVPGDAVVRAVQAVTNGSATPAEAARAFIAEVAQEPKP